MKRKSFSPWGRRVLLLLVLAMFLGVGGCSTVQLSQDYRPGFSFARYHTYGWRVAASPPSNDSRVNNPLLQERFHAAIASHLAARGYAPSPGLPDFLVSYQYSITTRVETVPDGPSFAFGYGRYWRDGAIGFDMMPDVRQYDVGTLVIDFYDRATGAMIWRGSGSQIVTTPSTPQASIAFVNKMVSAILSQFPPH